MVAIQHCYFNKVVIVSKAVCHIIEFYGHIHSVSIYLLLFFFDIDTLLAVQLSRHSNSALLKALDMFGNCQRPLFSLGVSQHMHKITNL